MRFMRDIWVSLGLLTRRPGTLALALLTLALGIGASTAIFSVIRGVLLKRLPFPAADRMVVAWDSKPEVDLAQSPVAALNYKDWRDGSRDLFQSLVAIQEVRLTLRGGEEPQIVRGVFATGDFFQMAGVPPMLGRPFGPDDDRPHAGKVAVLSHGLWQRQFGGDQRAIGRSITLDGEAYTVIGVMPSGFDLPKDSQLWSPLGLDFAKANRVAHELTVMGRLRAGVSMERAQARLSGIASRLAMDHPESNRGWGVRVASLQDSLVANARPALIVLLVAVAFVLLIACANVANLLLSRIVEREREIAIRSALGAGKADLVRQILAESVTLFLAGGLAGLLLAAWGTRLLVSLNPDAVPRSQEIGVDGWVLAFTLVVSLLTGLVVGLVPALNALEGELHLSLKEGGHGLAGGVRGRRIRNVLVTTQVAVSLVLLVGAALLLQSFSRLRSVDPGFSSRNVLTLSMLLPPARYNDPELIVAYQEILSRIEALPGVRRAASVFPLPFAPNDLLLVFTAEGGAPPDPNETLSASVKIVSPGYFEALKIPVLEGRTFTAQDDQRGAKVVVVNRKLARQIWPGEDAVGRRITFGSTGPGARWLTVVGVVGETRSSALSKEPVLEAYWPVYQTPFASASLLVNSEKDPVRLAGPVREVIRTVDRSAPIDKVRTLEEIVSASLAESRFKAALLGIFAGLALVLAAVGIYGVISYSVSRRTHEIGVRMALGADRRQVLWLVVSRGMVLVVIGLALGLLAARFASRLLSDQVYGVTPGDPLTFVAVPLLLVAVALFANYLPARRATRVEPLEALRSE